MASPAQWLEGARPRTLPAAVAPVLVGTGAAACVDRFVAVRALLALVVSVGLQVGVNYANDYSDGVRGTDADRVGPFRLVGSGAAAPASVRAAALISFAVTAAAGLVLAAQSSWWLVAVGAAAIAAAWLYTGGPRPYGYAGLGELFVFVFFGLVAVCGTTYVQAGRVTPLSVVVAVPVGLLSCALLVVNNLRDVPTDAMAGKRTLAVRMGADRTRMLYAVLVLLPFAVPVGLALRHRPWTLLALLALGLAVPAVSRVRRGAAGRELIPVLRDTARVLLAYSALLALGLALH